MNKMNKQELLVVLLVIIFLSPASINAQSEQKIIDLGKAEQRKIEEIDDEAQIQKSVLLSNLAAVETDAESLNSPLTRAIVKIEIADVAWNWDKQWAQHLLRAAFDLALPDKETRSKFQKLKRGAHPLEPTQEIRSQNEVRHKILAIARRDPVFHDELVELAKEEMGELEEVRSYSSSAYESLKADDKKQAIEYINKIFEADPSQVSAGGAIREMAIRDRSEADKLILAYIQRLRAFPINSDNVNRVFSSLRQAVFPAPPFDAQGRRIPVAGIEAMQAYYGFLIDSLLGLESVEPGVGMKFRQMITSMWPFISKQAPELTNSYMSLETISRIPGRPDSLQTSSLDERGKAEYEMAVRNAQMDKAQDAIVKAIKMALGRQDYATCRKLIDDLPEGALRSTYSEDVNRSEAISLLGKKDFDGAAQIAAKLNDAESLMQVYPQLIKFCVDKNDSQRAISLASEITRKLEKKQESSKAAFILSRMAGTIATKNETMAIELLRQAVSAANASDVKRDAENPHKVVFDTNVFELLAPNYESQMYQMAKSLDDRLHGLLAVVAIYRGKSNLLKRTSNSNLAPKK